MKTILVTGGAGFVGSHTCKALARAGYTPITFGNLERRHDWVVQWEAKRTSRIRAMGVLFKWYLKSRSRVKSESTGLHPVSKARS
jgi:nucleoside-diphosphate-sugar epimerase